MHSTLLAWLGMADLAASRGEEKAGLGPIAQALRALRFNRVVILSDHDKKKTETYLAWLKEQTGNQAEVRPCKLTKPTAYGEIYKAAVEVIRTLQSDAEEKIDLTFHLSPGTPAMAAVWLLLAKTRFPATLIESSVQDGVHRVNVPFQISAEFLPAYSRHVERTIETVAEGAVPYGASFGQIVYQCQAMDLVVHQAQRMAKFSVPVLIEGESGTGKELFANAIHATSRPGKPFRALNCGAIPQHLVEGELFGYRKGAFTGASEAHKGYFRDAEGGTLFLDEIGELPPETQVKLLRVLQEKKVTPLGETKAIPIDVRIICATNRDLMAEVAAGRFREDLFYRIAVGILRLPPLRERRGDITLLADYLLDQINIDFQSAPGYTSKKLSPGAKNVILNHDWPGNVRELQNTLHRAALWSTGTTVTEEHIRQALLVRTASKDVLKRPLGNGFDLDGLLDDVARDYIARALGEANGNKTKAAELLGLKSHQTLSNWIKRTGVPLGAGVGANK